MNESKFSLRDGREVVYRKLRRGDEKSLAEFNSSLSPASRVFFTPHGYDDATLAKVVERVERGEDIAFVALDGNRVVAYWFLWWVNTPFPVLGIGMLDEYQGQGLGRRIMAQLIETAEKAGCHAIELTTTPDNKAGQALYGKMGFLHNGIVENVAGDGRIVREWLMYYPIKPDITPPPRQHCPPV